MSFSELLSRFALAFGIGLLIGLERGWHKREERSGGRTAGVRTFAISGLLGGVVAALGATADGRLSLGGSILLSSVFFAFAVVIAAFGRDENKAKQSFSATTTIAALVTFMLGAYALLGDVRLAAAAAVATTGILIIREELHGWVRKITLAEFHSALVLLAMTFIALPIIPNRAMGPFGGVNPREIWLIAIVLAAISFAGYVAVKLLGTQRGTLLAAATGGLVSSTAVTLANARRAAAGESAPHLLAAGTALANAVSFARVGAIIGALQPTLLPFAAPALTVAALISTSLAFVAAYWRAPKTDDKAVMQLRNPFDFWAVTLVAASLGVLIMAGHLIYDYFGAAGAISGAVAMGLFDVDAMTVSMTHLALLPPGLPTIACAILAGVASNMISKLVISVAVERGRYAMHVGIMTAICIAAGGLTTWVTLAFIGSQ